MIYPEDGSTQNHLKSVQLCLSSRNSSYLNKRRHAYQYMLLSKSEDVGG
jgi:hypothetical protein